MKLCTRSILGIFMLMSSCYHFVDSRPGFHRSLVRRDTISDTCTEQQKILFRPALKEAQTIAKNMYERTKDLLDWLQVPKEKRPKPTQAQFIAYETFHFMFGRILWEGDTGKDGLEYVQKIAKTAQKMKTNILNDQTKLDYYCGDEWLKDKDDDNNDRRGPGYYWDTSLPTPGWQQFENICREDKDGNTPSKLQGQLTSFPKTVRPRDRMMVCTQEFINWATKPQLTAEKEKTFDVGEKSLDDYTSSSGLLLMHELSHSTEVLDIDDLYAYDEDEFYEFDHIKLTEVIDPDVPEDTMVKVFNFEIPCDYGKPTCYHWWGVQAVSSKNDYENQIVATSAAENIAYYAVALYLDKNEWYTGTSGPLPIPPSDPPSNPTSEA